MSVNYTKTPFISMTSTVVGKKELCRRRDISMQTESWLNDTGHLDQCPLCSRPLYQGMTTCYACGYSLPASGSSSVWIDPAYYNQAGRRSGAQQRSSQPAQKRSQPRNPATPQPPVPQQREQAAQRRQPSAQQPAVQIQQLSPASPPVRQYESPGFEAAGSLSALSLFVSDAPTRPQPPVARTTRRLPRIDEMDTTPPKTSEAAPEPEHNEGHISLRLDESSLPASLALVPAPGAIRDIDKIDTMPQFHAAPTQQMLPVTHATESDLASWTAGRSMHSSRARLIIEKKMRAKQPFHPVDNLRWWLLGPGRLESLLWLGGTVLLFFLTCLLLVVTAFHFQWLFVTKSPIASNAGNGSKQKQSTVTTSPGLQLTLYGDGMVRTGHALHLHGQGFTAHGTVTFTLDGSLPLLNQQGEPAEVVAGDRGQFDVTLWFGSGQNWTPGSHQLIARDLATKRLAAVAIVLLGSSGVQATPTSVPSGQGSTPAPQPTSTPDSTPTPVKTPATPAPSPSPSPSPSPTQTPSPSPSPSPTRTGSPTPTVTSTPSHNNVTPTVGPSSGNSTLGNSLNQEPPASLTGINPLVYLIVLSYTLSLILFGVAALVRKRRM